MNSSIKPIQVLSKNEDAWQTINQIIKVQIEEAFYLCDVDDIIEKYQRWKSMMPRVEPYYAVKCNNHTIVLKVLSALGLGFDCASKNEIDQVLSLGVNPSRIIYAHTTKPANHLRFAAASRVRLMTFDNEMELYKIKNICPEARAVIRIRYDAKNAIRVLGKKFGCDAFTEASQLLQIARNLGIDVVGVSFHVGSGCQDPSAFSGAIASARYVFDVATTLGYHFELLDIGGGFPGQKDSSCIFSEYASVIKKSLEEHFPDDSVTIISEPGMYFVDSAFTLVANVHSLKEIPVDTHTTGYAYYINDGLFGSLHPASEMSLTPEPLQHCDGVERYPSTVWGPTCDSIDKICEDILLPKLNLGDWLVFFNMGAYSLCLSSTFNGFESPEVYSRISVENWLLLKKQKPLKETDFVQIKNLNSSTKNEETTHYEFSANFFIRG